MLNFSFASVLMAIVTSNLFIIIITLIFMKQSVMREVGFSLLGMLCAFVFIRMLFPFELANITRNISLPRAISMIMSFIRNPCIPILGHNCSIWDILVLIWGIGFLVVFFDYILSIKRTYKFIREKGTDITDDTAYKAAIGQLGLKKKLRDKITILQLPVLKSPAVLRYHFRYYIVMPDDLVLDEDEQGLIIMHEVLHILHHDITMKFFLQIICLFYWWNPFCHKLMKRSNLLFELRVDSSVVAGDEERIEKYIACLVKVKKHISGKKDLRMPSAIRFSLNLKSDTYIRVFFLLENKKMRTKILTKLIALPLCIVYILSFVFIFEGYYISPEYVAEAEEINSENTYIVKNHENTYDIYFYGNHIDTVSTLEYYPEDCKIYLSLKEAQENEKN